LSLRVLVVGSGGREHALVRALRRSPQAPELFAVPGNPGIAADARLLEGDPLDLARSEAIDLVLVGPEAPLVDGLVDRLAEAGIAAFGPRAAAAELEGSKAFAKEIMEAAGVPTAAWSRHTTVDGALGAIERYPAVLKADGLAAGKGVVIAADEAEAREALEAMLVERRFGEMPVVVEEHLEGEELSLLALCDGERALAMAPARDFKRIGEGDAGPNTGGMGSYSPVDGIDVEAIVAAVHQPVVDELRRRGTPFHGILYAGLMLTADGPKVIEFNVRFGDPEAQALLPRLRSDLLDLLLRSTRPGGLAGAEMDWDPATAVTVVLASAGYPASARSGDVITGLEKAAALRAEVTHAGTALDAAGSVVTAGGRVVNVTALGADAGVARAAAYAAADVIQFDGKQLRRDIALKAVPGTISSGATINSDSTGMVE
jgi:phosphoribosylamine--glycine ligase